MLIQMFPWSPNEKFDIFGIFEVRHANQGWTNGIYNLGYAYVSPNMLLKVSSPIKFFCIRNLELGGNATGALEFRPPML